jgi:inositol-pentakisphosphate 2-kinase
MFVVFQFSALPCVEIFSFALVQPDAIMKVWGGERNLREFRCEFIATIVDLLLESPVLDILSRHQRDLDVLDIEGISKLWRSSQLESSDQPPAPIASTLSEPTISEWTEFLERYLAMHDRMDHLHPNSSDLRYYIYASLLSAGLKDSSLILRLEPRRTSSPSTPSVSVIDLDPKSVRRLRKWENLDKEIVEAYMSVELQKLCIDGGVA